MLGQYYRGIDWRCCLSADDILHNLNQAEREESDHHNADHNIWNGAVLVEVVLSLFIGLHTNQRSEDAEHYLPPS